MSQTSISSFFKRKPEGVESSSSPIKKPRIEKPVERVKTPPQTPLSDRTRHWHIDDNSEYSQNTPEKRANHERFVEKLSDFDSRKRRERSPEEQGEAAELDSDGEPIANGKDDNDDADVDDKVVSDLTTKFALNTSTEPVVKRKASAKKAGPKLTPLEIQIQKIQEENPSAILMVEVGYKYRFFGPDARTASQILGIAYFKSHSFLTASVPVHRLQVHVNRLVKAGKKVGVVRQIETAALKAIGDNRNKTFERKLCEVYSKGTYLGDNEDDAAGGWILAIVEDSMRSESAPPETASDPESHRMEADVEIPKESRTVTSGSDLVVKIGVVAVRAESGEVIYDTFADGTLRGELEKRLLLLDVIEIIAVGDISKTTKKIIDTSERRIEEVLRGPADEARNKVREFYTSRYSEKDAAPILGKIMNLPNSILECLGAQISYLAEFNLESIFTLTNFFQPFENRLCMQLPATTIAALEVFQNTTDGSEKGSLFWVLNHTKTLPGKRLLRKWMARPLVNEDDLKGRQEAVEEIVEARGTTFAQIEKARIMLKKLPDLEKGLSKIFYGKCTRPEVLQTLLAFSRISRAFDSREVFAFKSPILKDSLSSFSSIASTIESFLGEFNHVEAAKDDKFNMFKESDTLDSISDHKMGILIIESDLRDHLKEIGKVLKRKVVEYVTVAGIEFLIELKNDATKLVPKYWIKVSGTKFVSRFHTPQIIKLIAERDQRKELLAIECDQAYKSFLKRISDHYDTLRWIVSSIATLDCLLSLSIVSADESYTKPEFLPASAPTTIRLTDSRHPVIEALLSDTYIPNDCTLRSDTTRAMILSGPNMGGKSSYIKQIALICILAQIGCYVPCSSATMSILDGVYCRMGASDNLLTRESTFMVELHECSDIMAVATPKSLVILDELGRGTSTFDGVAIASSVLDYFLHTLKSLLLFVTHYPNLDHGKEKTTLLKSAHMGHLGDSDSVTFLYKLVDGTATRSYGLNVARLAGLPDSLLLRAEELAKQFERDLRARELDHLRRKLLALASVDDEKSQIDAIIRRL